MEDLPVEIVGDIMSRIGEARPVVLASATCRKWRQAFRDHLRVLSFRSEDFRGLGDSEVQAMMSRAILQTTSLQSLTIEVHRKFSRSAVMRWLRHARKSLRVFRFVVDSMDSPLDCVEICGWEKLEELVLTHAVIEGVNPDSRQFSSLKSLALQHCRVRNSEEDLSGLLSVCPNLESLKLIRLDSDLHHHTVVAPPSIRRICVHINCTELILKSDGLEHLELTGAFDLFKFIGKGTLKNITMETARFGDIDICDSGENLETIHISPTVIPKSELYQLISKSSKLRSLSLSHLCVGYELDHGWVEPADLEFIAASCPQLSHLSLGCELGDDDDLREYGLDFPYRLGGSTRFENVIYLKVGWSDTLEGKFLDAFFDLVEGMLERCPSLKELVIDGNPADVTDQKDGEVIAARFASGISRIRRKCIDSKVTVFSDSFHGCA